MRKTAAFCALAAILLTSGSPLIAQRAVSRAAKELRQSPAQFVGIRAITDGGGVLIRWSAEREITAAYNVYRLNSSGKVRANSSLIAGSIAQYGEKPATGEVRQFFDLNGKVGDMYVVEGIRPDGSAFSSTKVIVEPVPSVEAESGTSSQVFQQASVSSNRSVESRRASLAGDLSDLVSLYTQQPNAANQRIIASRPGAKIAVRKDGFYRVTAAELQAANFVLDSDSTKWRLFTNGVEQAILVASDDSYIEFYGRGLDLPETDTRVYYLVSDTVAGKRIESKFLRTLPGVPTAKNFPVVAVKKERVEFNNKLFNGDEENFLGRFFSVQPLTVEFNLSGVDYSVAEATVSISLYGLLNNQHEVRPILNGVELPPIREFGTVFFSGEYQVPTENLREGENELQLVSHAPSDFDHFDKIEVSYKRTYSADGGKLSFATPGYKKLELSGFGSSAVRVFDLTFEGSPVLLKGLSATESESGYTVTVPSTRAMVGYAVEDIAVLQSPSVTANTPSTLSATDRRSDMLIISHSAPSFINASRSWANYRSSPAGGSLNVDVIDVTDIYDEFNYGIVSADSLKSFLSYASTEWAFAPRYVLLIGDATYDPRNYEGYGQHNLVPTRIVTLQAEESGSDEALGDFDGDGLSAIAIGRIPARTSEQIVTALNKTIDYDASQAEFGRGVLFADDNSPEFEAMSQQLAQRLPEGTPSSMVAAGEANANANLLEGMRRGNFLVNYSGHGSSGLWANGDFFTVSMVPQVTNRRGPSVFSMLTCASGFFLRPSADSLSEALIFSREGGAAAAWASTSLTTADDQLQMADKYFQKMSEAGQGRMGDSIKEAKAAINAGADVRLSWVLLGDPMLKTP